jgi:hypothetical protein
VLAQEQLRDDMDDRPVRFASAASTHKRGLMSEAGRLLVAIASLAAATVVTAQVCAVPGNEGFASTGGILNTYYPASVVSGTNQTVGPAFVSSSLARVIVRALTFLVLRPI